MSVANISINVTTAVAAPHVGVGFYTYAASDASATLLGSVTLSSAATGLVTGSPTAFTLGPGWYWFAMTSDAAALAIVVEGVNTGISPADLLSASGQRVNATAANASAAGVLPATTGALGAAQSGVAFPCALVNG